MIDSGIVESEFVLQSRYYVGYHTNERIFIVMIIDTSLIRFTYKYKIRLIPSFGFNKEKSESISKPISCEIITNPLARLAEAVEYTDPTSAEG